MKRLHKSAPKEWDAHKLSECFPATKVVCERVIKSNYSRADPEKIKEIDEQVSSI